MRVFCIRRTRKITKYCKIVQKRSTELTIEGLLLTMYDTRLRLSNQVVEEVKTHFQDLVLKQLFIEMLL